MLWESSSLLLRVKRWVRHYGSHICFSEPFRSISTLLVDTGDIPFLYTRQGNELLTFSPPVTTPHALELQCTSNHIFLRVLYDDDDDER